MSSERSRLRLLAALVAGAAGPISIYIAQPIAPLIADKFGLSPAAAGTAIAAPTIGLALASPIAGAISDRLGRKPVIVAALACMILPTLAASIAPSYGALLACQLLIGLLIPGVAAVTLAYVGEEFPGQSTGQAIALVISANIAGGFIGRFVSALAAQHGGWPMSFRIIAALQVTACMAVLALLPPSRHFRPGTTVSTAALATWHHLTDLRLLRVFLVGFCTLFLIVGVFTYSGFRLMSEPFGWSVGDIGYLYLLYLLSLLTNPAIGLLIARTSPRFVHGLGVLGCIAGLALTLSADLTLVLGGLVLFIVCAFASQSAASTQLMREATSAKGAASGLYASFYYVGGGLGAALPGPAWTHYGWAGTATVFLLVAGLAGAISQFTWRTSTTHLP